MRKAALFKALLGEPNATEARLTVANVSKNEGNSGTNNDVFTVKLSTANSEVVTVDFNTADNSASQGLDYTAASGTLTYQPGETSKTITVHVRGDIDIENTETFFVQLSNSSGPTIGVAQAIGTITNDDTLRSGQVMIRIVGSGFVTDSTGQIDTRVGCNSAIYALNTFPFLHASSPFVEWSDPSFFTQAPPTHRQRLRQRPHSHGHVFLERGLNVVPTNDRTTLGLPRTHPRSFAPTSSLRDFRHCGYATGA